MGSKIILIGNPNVGKSVIFHRITGKYTQVSNYPGTTVEINSGITTINNQNYEVIDTPGINSLFAQSQDEKITRNIILKGFIQKSEHPYCIVQICDGKNINRGLIITLQILKLGLPLVLVLNMMDEVKDAGININSYYR